MKNQHNSVKPWRSRSSRQETMDCGHAHRNTRLDKGRHTNAPAGNQLYITQGFEGSTEWQSNLFLGTRIRYPRLFFRTSSRKESCPGILVGCCSYMNRTNSCGRHREVPGKLCSPVSARYSLATSRNSALHICRQPCLCASETFVRR